MVTLASVGKIGISAKYFEDQKLRVRKFACLTPSSSLISFGATAAQLSQAPKQHKSAIYICKPSPLSAASRASSVVAAAAAAADPKTAPKFDWRAGLALAGCAFEAYNGLDDAGTACIRQTTVGGTQIAYVDPSFLKNKLAGFVEVTVVSATGLKNAEWMIGDKSDPYCQVSIGGSCARTKTIDNNLNPTWNETLFLFAQDLQKQRLTVRVLDEDVADSDDLLGAGMRGLKDLEDGSEIEVQVPLAGDGGTVTLHLQYFPFTDETTLAEAASSARMGGPVLGTPANAFFNSPWRNLKELLIPAELAAEQDFDPLCFVDNPLSDTQAWLFWNTQTRKLVVSFRGTEQTRLKDIITDLSLVPSALDPDGDGTMGDGKDPAATVAKGFDAIREGLTAQGAGLRASLKMGVKAMTQKDAPADEWVHAGFLKAYRTVRADVTQLVDTVLEGETQPWTVYITGHSLGGALSTLCSYDLAKRPASTWPGGRKPEVIINYSFGSPRVGNRTFAEQFNSLVPNAWRVVNNGDAVTSVPRLMGYAHVGHKVTITPEGKVEVEYDTIDSSGEGVTATDVAAAVVSTALGPDKEGAEKTSAIDSVAELQALIDAEKQALAGILDGSAVAEHLENLYVENMDKAIQQHFAAKR